MPLQLPVPPKNNYTAIVVPVVGNDDTQGYIIGSQWIDTVLGGSFVCSDASTGAAVWVQTNSTPSTPAASLHTYQFGKTTHGSNAFCVAGGFGAISANLANETDVGTRQTVVHNATISRVLYSTYAFPVLITTTMYVNGVSQGVTFPHSGPHGTATFTTPVVVVAGDEISMEVSLPGATIGYVVLAEGHAASSHSFGASLSTLGRYARANAWAGSPSISGGVVDNAESIVVTGNAVVGSVNIGYQTSLGTVGTIFQLLKNGSPVESFTATGGQGVAAMTTTFATGDEMAIEWDSGVQPNGCVFTVHIDNPVYTLSWGGSPNAAAERFLWAYGNPGASALVTSIATLTSGQILACPIAGTIRGAINSTPNTLPATLYKNGIFFATLFDSLDQIGTVNVNDVLAVSYNNTVATQVMLEITPIPTF